MTVEIALLHRVLPAGRVPSEPGVFGTVDPEVLDAFLAERADWERPPPGQIAEPGSDAPRVMVTVDGADATFEEHTLPRLERHGVHCVLFVVADWARGVREPLDAALWRTLGRLKQVEIPLEGIVPLRSHPARVRAFDQLRRLYEPLPTAEREGLVAALGVDPCEPEPGAFLSPDRIRALAAHPLVTIGAQSRTHPVLTRLNPEHLAAEVAGSKREIEHWLGERIEWFAYPYGEHSRAVRRCVKATGFRFACAADPGGFEPAEADLLVLPRTDLALAGQAAVAATTPLR